MDHQENINVRSEPISPSSYEEDEINLMDYWRIVVKYKWMILVIIVLTTAAATLKALLSPPIYRAEVVLAPVSQEDQGRLSGLSGQFGGLASMVGIDLGGGGNGTATTIAILKSRIFTEQFIRKYNLLPVLYEDNWDNKNQRWIQGNSEDIPTMWDAYKVFNEIRKISKDKKTGLITLSIEWKDPVIVSSWANDLVARLNISLRADALEESKRSLEYLKDQIEKTSIVEIRQLMYGLVETEMKKAMLANAGGEYAFRVIDPAVVPQERIGPNRRMIVIVGLFIGAAFGIFAAIFLSFIQTHKNGQ